MQKGTILYYNLNRVTTNYVCYPNNDRCCSASVLLGLSVTNIFGFDSESVSPPNLPGYTACILCTFINIWYLMQVSTRGLHKWRTENSNWHMRSKSLGYMTSWLDNGYDSCMNHWSSEDKTWHWWYWQMAQGVHSSRRCHKRVVSGRRWTFATGEEHEEP